MSASLLEVSNLEVTFRRPGLRRPSFLAVDDVSFQVEPGRTLAIVGESGSGKTTVARTVCGLQRRSAGTVRFDQTELADGSIDPRIQMIFQDPFGSLHPRTPVGDQISAFWRIHGMPRSERTRRLDEIMHLVGLDARDSDRFPHEFSGGQRQRIGIARALVAEPRLLICDEPVSALDVSIQAQIINLLDDLQERLGLAYLFISHDLQLVRRLADDVMVMYRGRAVEYGSAESIFESPEDPYTIALLAATPVLDRGGR